jgi:hypothetical protein
MEMRSGEIAVKSEIETVPGTREKPWGKTSEIYGAGDF